jgi:exopolyphosphatase/guanosine-5'-triphosphate,3'-diphosphate pyrophosphatase
MNRPARLKPKDDTFAVIDAGSNAIRLQIARIADQGSYRIVEQLRHPVRLGHGVFETGVLDTRTRESALRVLKRFKSRTDRLGVTAMRAVATSAMREAKDAAAFVAAAAEIGVTLEVLSEQDEARLTTIGILSGLSFDPPGALFVDIGGGSLELAAGNRAGTTAAVSLPLGAVRLTERFIRRDPPSADQCAAMTEFIRGQLAVSASVLKPDSFTVAFGSGGTFTSLAHVDAHLSGVIPLTLPYTLQRNRIEELYTSFRAQPLRERAALLDGNRRRAGILVAGAAVLVEVLNKLGIDSVSASGRGLRDGLMVSLLRERVTSYSGEWRQNGPAPSFIHTTKSS